MVMIPNAGENLEKMRLSYIAAVKVKWHSHSGTWFWQYLPYDSVIALLSIYARKIKTYFTQKPIYKHS